MASPFSIKCSNDVSTYGTKVECKPVVVLTSQDWGKFTLGEHTEFKYGFAQPTYYFRDGEDQYLTSEDDEGTVTTNTTNTSGTVNSAIFKPNEYAFPIVKAVALNYEIKLEGDASVETVRASAGWVDLFRDFSTNHWKGLGMERAGTYLRTPYFFAFERPLHDAPGANLSFAVQNDGAIGGENQFFHYEALGFGNARKSSGMWGIKGKDAGGKLYPEPIWVSGRNYETNADGVKIYNGEDNPADPFTQGLYFTFNAGVGANLGPVNLVLDYAFASRSYPELFDANSPDEETGEPSQIQEEKTSYNHVIAGALGLFDNRVEIYGDYSIVAFRYPEADDARNTDLLNATSLRLGIDGLIYGHKWDGKPISGFDLYAYGGLRSTRVPSLSSSTVTIDSEGSVGNDIPAFGTTTDDSGDAGSSETITTEEIKWTQGFAGTLGIRPVVAVGKNVKIDGSFGVALMNQSTGVMTSTGEDPVTEGPYQLTLPDGTGIHPDARISLIFGF